jgi:hypothetical protein
VGIKPMWRSALRGIVVSFLFAGLPAAAAHAASPADLVVVATPGGPVGVSQAGTFTAHRSRWRSRRRQVQAAARPTRAAVPAARAVVRPAVPTATTTARGRAAEVAARAPAAVALA